MRWIIRTVPVAGPVNADMAIVHFKKAVPGAHQVITTATAAGLQNCYRSIDRECVRESGMRYLPVHMVEVHHAVRDDLEACYG